MSEKKISIYRKINDTKSQNTFTIDDFLTGVKNGHWQDCVLEVRAGRKKKTECQAVTVAGVFDERKDDKLKQHSGFIAIDVDYKDFKERYTTEKLKQILCKDQYTYACFVSISGYGLVVLVKIDPKHHRDIFRSLENYYYENYGVPIDRTSVNESRARFVSFDADLFRNNSSQKYTHRLAPKIDQKKSYSIPFTNSDIDHCIAQIQENGIDITGDYPQWKDIGLALAHQFGESGLDYFMVVSQNSPKFDEKFARDQYTKYCRHDEGWVGERKTIASFFYFCRLYGVEITDKTKQITSVARQRRKGKAKKEEVKKQVVSTGLASPDDPGASEVVDQVYNEKSTDQKQNDLKIKDQAKLYLKTNHNLWLNEITRKWEDNGEELTEGDIIAIYDSMDDHIEKEYPFEKFERLIKNRNFVKPYNPIKNWLESHDPSKIEEGYIKKLCSCVPSDTLYYDEFITKWIVGIIAAIYGRPNPLILILCGTIHGAGKTEFFRRLLPERLQRYYAESRFSYKRQDDNDRLLTKKLIVMDDEFGGKKDYEYFKDIASKQKFTVRFPYGKMEEDLNRLASIAGTANKFDIIDDPTGNRRFVPINVNGYIDTKKFNSIDKEKVMLEAYKLYCVGFDWQILREDIDKLNKATENFYAQSTEREMFLKYFDIGDNSDPHSVHMQVSEIAAHIQESSNIKIDVKEIAPHIISLGGVKKKIKGKRGYYVKPKSQISSGGAPY